MRETLPLIITVNLISIGATLLILLNGWSLEMTSEDVEQIGGSMSLLLLAFGLAAHLRARKGDSASAALALIGLPGPVYALMGGSSMHVAGYHVVTLGIGALVLYSLRKHEGES